MKIKIDNKEEYELSEECFKSLLAILGKAIEQANFPSEIRDPLLELQGFSHKDLTILLSRLRDNTLSFYLNLHDVLRLGAIQIARRWISRQEKKIESKEAREIFRVPRRKDPIEHMIDIFYPIIEHTIIPEIARIQDGTTIELTTQDNTVTAINFTQDISGREMAAHGDIR